MGTAADDGRDGAAAAFASASASLTAALDNGDDLCAPLVSAVPMRGAVVSTLGSPLGSQTVCATTSLAARIDEIQIDLGEGPSWDALRTMRPVSAPDLQAEGGSEWPSAWSALRELDLGALYAFPLFVGTIGVGSVGLYSMAPGRLSDDQIEGVMVLATLVSRHLLRRALDDVGEVDGIADGPYSRREMHQATGMIAAGAGVSVDDALLLLRARAYAAGRPVREYATDIIARRIDLEAFAGEA